MSNDKNIIDAELNEWLKTEDAAEELDEVVNRVNRFAAGEEPAGDLVQRVRRGLASQTHSRRGPLLRMAMAAGFLIAAAGVGFYFGQPRGGAEIAWGDVVSAMQKVDQFHVTAFGDDSGGAEKMFHIDLYYQRPNHWRAQGMNYIQIGVKPDARLYSVNDHKFVEFGPQVPRLVPDDFAAAVERGDLLNAIVGMLYGSNAPPQGVPVNDPSMRDAGIQVFDYRDWSPGKIGGEAARIWVIERSRLPIRLEVTDTLTGAKTLATLDYSETKPAEFFDAALFERNVEAGGPPTTRDAYENHFVADDVAAWYKLACNWTEPATTLKYSENPADLPAEGKLPENGQLEGYAVGPAESLKKFNAMDRSGAWPPKNLPEGVRYIIAVNLNLGPVDFVPMYHANGSKALMNEPQVFVHERTSTGGLTWLLSVEVTGFKDSRLQLNVAKTGPRGKSYEMQESYITSVDMAGICGPGEIRLYAGQPDSKDASRFSIPFEARGRHGWIDGQFKDQKDAQKALWETQLTVRTSNP